MNVTFGEPAWAKALAAQLTTVISNQNTIISNQEKELTIMSTSVNTIAQLAADFTKYQGDAAKFFADFATFSTAVKAFIASATSGANGTVLSSADAATLGNIDTAIQGLDTQAQQADSSLAAITIPSQPSAS